MYVSLLMLGLFATAAGVAMVGFGIPINEFGLGNTLIIAGTTAIVGGLILIALAEAVRQLRRIAEGLMARPSPRVSRPNDQLDNLMSGASRNGGAGQGRITFPPKPGAEGRSRGPAPFEQRLAAAPSIEDDAPLSPQEPAHRAMEPRLGMMDFAPEPREADISRSTTDVLPISRLDVSSRPVPPSEAAPKNDLFESLWPAKPGKTPKVEPAPAAQPAENQKDEPAEEISEEEAAAEPYAVSILKSGMVDGMAYTLFSDGSIEAELPQGTVRFASITELRAYLEKSS